MGSAEHQNKFCEFICSFADCGCLIMNEYFMIEVHVISKDKETILDIDCNVGVETTLFDLLEIHFY